MVTFNEQKGQGVFQPVLSEPGGQGGGSGPTQPGAGLSGAASAIEGVGNVFDILAARPLPPDVESEELVGNRAVLESELAGIIGGVAADSLGSGPVKQATNELATLGQSFRQGNMTQAEINVRLASAVQRFIAGDPRNADVYRELARDVAGFVPTAQIVADRRAELDDAREQQQAVTDSFVNAAIDVGVTVLNQDGSVDISSTANAGQVILQDQARLDQVKEQLALAKTRSEIATGKKMTEAEIKRSEFTKSNEALAPFISHYHTGLATQIQQVSKFNQGDLSPEQLAQVQEGIGVQRAGIVFAINQFAIQNNLSNDTRNDLIATHTGTYDQFTELLTGDFSQMKANVDMLARINAAIDLDIAESAPELNKLRRLGGERLMESVVTATIAADPESRGVVSAELKGILSDTADLNNGTVSIEDMSATERKNSTKGSMAAIRRLSTTSGLTDQESSALATTHNNMMDMAQRTTVLNRATATDQLSSDAMIANIKNKASDTNYGAIGAKLRDLNGQVFIESARRSQPTGRAEGLFKFALTRGKAKPDTFRAVYDGRTGRVILQQSDDGKNFRAATVARLPRDLRLHVERMNRNLDVIVELKDVGPSDLKGISDQQIRQAIVGNSLPVINQE